MAMRIPGPKKPEAGTLLGNATSVSPEWYSIPKPASPNWHKWSNMAMVELWEAVALSLNIEPVCDLQGTSPDFDSRMEIAVSHLRTGGALEAVERNPRLHCSRVRLGDVANLAASCVPAWVLPVEFPKPLAAPVNTQPAATSGASETGEATAHGITPIRPPPAQRFQEQEILRVIGELGHDPKALPKDIPGKAGVKAEVRKRLKLSASVFNKAWERLSICGEIAKLK